MPQFIANTIKDLVNSHEQAFMTERTGSFGKQVPVQLHSTILAMQYKESGVLGTNQLYEEWKGIAK